MNSQLSYTELKKLVERISNELQQKESEVAKLKHSFLANVSHEVRTPMNVIVGFSNLLSDPNYNDEQKKFFIAEINKNSRLLLRLIDQILLISKIQNSAIDLYNSDCNITKLFDELNNYYTEYLCELGNKQLKLLYNKPRDNNKDVIIITDKDKLKESVKGLIENAIRFTKRGTISFGFTPAKNEIRFFVQDTGIGIEDKHLKLIFEKFYTVKNKEGNQEMGLGIGLTIADKLIQLLGGKLLVESEPGRGTRFQFSLPHKIAREVNLST